MPIESLISASCEINGAHAAAANLANDFVGANALAYPRLFVDGPFIVVAVGKRIYSGAMQSGRDEKRSGLLMRDQQPLNSTVQFGIALACLVEKCRAMAFVNLEGGMKEAL